MSTIELDKVISYRVQTSEGPLLMEHTSTWNGMMELTDAKGRKLILAPTDGVFSQAFGAVLGSASGKSNAHVVMASPELGCVILVTGDGGPAKA